MAASKSNFFKDLEALPPDAVLGIAAAFRADQSPKKVNLGIGAYRTEDNKPHVFEVVRQTEKELAADLSLNKEYFPEDGMPDLKPLTQKLLFGKSDNRICSIQALSGTGALCIGGAFLRLRINPNAKFYISKPTWANHRKVFERLGFECVEYPYWNQETRSILIDDMVACLKEAPQGSVVLLQACAHNPTGNDPDDAQWKKILEVIIERKLFPFIDSAYQGFASGDLERDAKAVRLFEASGIELLVAQSFAKNMGLYGERAGMLHAVCSDAASAAVVMTHLKDCVRRTYSNPPIHSARLVSRILSNETKYKEWTVELSDVSKRIQDSRTLLRDALVKRKTPGNWDHIVKQIGMFSYTGLSVPQCQRMVEHWHVHMMTNGRISMAGINSSNLEYVAEALDDCVRKA